MFRCFRIGGRTRKQVFGIDEEREGDISIFLDDDKVLIIEDSVAEGVDNQKDGDEDSILDFVESPEGTRFTLS